MSALCQPQRPRPSATLFGEIILEVLQTHFCATPNPFKGIFSLSLSRSGMLKDTRTGSFAFLSCLSLHSFTAIHSSLYIPEVLLYRLSIFFTLISKGGYLLSCSLLNTDCMYSFAFSSSNKKSLHLLLNGVVFPF